MRKVLAIVLLLFSIPYYYGNASATDTLQALGVYTDSPVELVLTDPQGRRTGFDPVTNTWFQEIPASAYDKGQTCDEQNFSSCNPPYVGLNMANQMDGQYILDVIGTESGDFRVHVTATDEAGNSINQTYTGTTAHGVRSRFIFQGRAIFFAAFGANLKITSASKAFEVNGTFTLGLGGTISPVTQPVSILLENSQNYFLEAITAGSFTPTPKGAFVFKGVINGITKCTMTAFARSTDCLRRDTEPTTYFDAHLTPTGANGYAFKIVGAGLTDLPSANPVEVRLAIGNNGGSVSVIADFAH